MFVKVNSKITISAAAIHPENIQATILKGNEEQSSISNSS